MDAGPGSLKFAVERFAATAQPIPQLLVGDTRPSKPKRALAKIKRAIQPMRLPEDLDWFWSQWDPRCFERALPHPRLVPPALALDCWRAARDHGPFPAVLFPIGYEPHGLLLVELELNDWFGSRVYEHGYHPGVAIEVRHLSMAAMFEDLTHAIESAGTFIDDPFEPAAFAEYIAAYGAHAVEQSKANARRWLKADELTIAADRPLAWPPRWRNAQRIDRSIFEPRGRTHTVQQLVDERTTRHVTARLHGHVSDLGRGGFDHRGAEVSIVRIEDETGVIDAIMTAGSTPFGAPLRSGSRYELEVTAEPTQPEPTQSLLRELKARSGELAHSLQRFAEEAVQITLVRPLD